MFVFVGAKIDAVGVLRQRVGPAAADARGARPAEDAPPVLGARGLAHGQGAGG